MHTKPASGQDLPRHHPAQPEPHALRCRALPFLSSLLLLSALVPLATPAQVVINEIFYHAPDDLDDLQFIEIHNAGDQPIPLDGWSFKGVQFTFPANTTIAPQGFQVMCRNAERFKEFYNVPIAGVFSSKLSKKGERLELRDASKKTVDSVPFEDRSPWPTGPDGESGSLERISPFGDGKDPANWVSSPLTETREKPSGTPGRPNAGYSRDLPPAKRQTHGLLRPDRTAQQILPAPESNR